MESKQEAWYGNLVVQHSTGSCVREGVPPLGQQQTGLSYTHWTGLLSSVSPAETAAVSGGGGAGWEGGRRASPPASCLAAFLMSLCFIIVLLNFVGIQANPVSHVINADKHISEQPVRNC